MPLISPPPTQDTGTGGNTPEMSGNYPEGYWTVGYWVGLNTMADPRNADPETTTTKIQDIMNLAGWDAGQIGLNAPLLGR